MRILLIHKHHYSLGGAEKYYLELSRLLTQKGHSVAHFSMEDARNEKSPWSKYFVSNISYDEIKIRESPKIFSRMIFSFEARKKLLNF